ncbi:MAG: arsenite efflux transporter metallochaperone ArsD [Eubacterium sp.]
MKKIEIFDPAMCCSTGVCGPGVDPELIRVATLLNSFEKAGKPVLRHNLSDDPQIYVDCKAVNDVLMNEGADALPIILVDGEVIRKGSYPSNEEMCEWLEITQEELAQKVPEKSKKCCCGGGNDKKSPCC